MSNSTTTLFGLSGVHVRRVDQLESGGRVVHVETAGGLGTGCPSCGVVSTSVKGNVTTAPRDLPYGETGISVVWHKTRWRCVEPSCVRLSFTESIAEVPAGWRTTGRLRRGIAAAVGDACRSVAEAATAYGVSWPTAHAAVEPEATAVLGIDETRRGKPRWTFSIATVLGIDETRRGKPRWTFSIADGRWVRSDAWDTGFVDLAGVQGLLGQVEGRTSAAVVTWLRERTPEFRAGIRFVAIDPAAVYAKAVRTVLADGTRLLPNAVIVVDHFHLVKLANDAVTAVRRRVVWEQKGRRGRKVDPAWANRRRLLTGRERLSHKGMTTMWNSLMDSEPTGQVLNGSALALAATIAATARTRDTPLGDTASTLIR